MNGHYSYRFYKFFKKIQKWKKNLPDASLKFITYKFLFLWDLMVEDEKNMANLQKPWWPYSTMINVSPG